MTSEVYFWPTTTELTARNGDVTIRFTTYSHLTKVATVMATADALTMLWQSSDIPLFDVEYATSPAKRIGLAYVPFPSTTTSFSPRRTSAAPPSGLITGAKAGRGVGTALGALFLIGMGSVLFFIRRRRSRASVGEANGPATAELEDQDATLATKKQYLGGQWRSEAEVMRDPGELDSRAVHVVPGPPAELEAGQGQRDD
jgi:hypothetical protein